MSKPKIDVDGPAIIAADGTQQWYVNGQLHRLHGPAVIDADGTQEWWVNGQLHRLDGPAVIGAYGTQEWWVNNKNITREVGQWMTQQSITWPWDAATQSLFLLTWG